MGLAATLTCLSELRAFRMSRFGLNGGVVSTAWCATAVVLGTAWSAAACGTLYCVAGHCLLYLGVALLATACCTWYCVACGCLLHLRCCVASHCLRYAILRG